MKPLKAVAGRHPATQPRKLRYTPPLLPVKPHRARWIHTALANWNTGTLAFEMAGVEDLVVGGLLGAASGALENRHQILTKGGAVYRIKVINFDTAGILCLLLDQTATPSNGAVTPVDCFFIGAGSATIPTFVDYVYPAYAPMQMANGLWMVASTVLTTPFSLTQSASGKTFFAALAQSA